MSDTPEELRVYEFFGVDFKVKGSQAIGGCPFCSKSRKFYISKKDGRYDCKSCQAKGNKFTFITEMVDLLLEESGEPDYELLNERRGGIFPTKYLREKRICFDEFGNALIPQKKPGNKNLSNLRKWNYQKKILYNAPTMCSLFYCTEWLEEGPVFICEGEWDAMALEILIKRSKKLESYTIVSQPGVNVFREAWAGQFVGREVYLLFDKDTPGQEGAKRTEKIILEKGKKVGDKSTEIKHLDWSKIDIPMEDKFDIRDYSTHFITQKKSQKGFRLLMEAMVESVQNEDKRRILDRSSFESVLTDFKNLYEVGQSFEDVLACCMAAIASLHISKNQKNPFWMFVVGPPSSGKTTIIESFDTSYEYTEQVSKLTPASFVTGLGIDTDEHDPSLLNRLKNKVLFAKDFTTILGMGQAKEEIFTILRDAYDGSYTHHFAKGTREYKNLYFGVVAGVTNVIYGENMTDLGERFLQIRNLDKDFDEEKHLDRALDNESSEGTDYSILRDSVYSYMQHILKTPYLPDFPDEYRDKLKAIAQLASVIRAKVSKRKGDLTYRPEAEIASRVAVQLKKLGQAIAFVYGKKQVDEGCYRVMQKVAFDSCVNWKLELLQVMANFDTGGGLTATRLAKIMNINVTQLRTILDEALQLNVVSYTTEKEKGKRGAPSSKYRISDRIQGLMERAGVTFEGEIVETPSNKTKRGKAK